MKYLFVIIALLLATASVGTYLSLPGVNSVIPIVYWVTDPNPARDEQINLFHRWLIKNGHTKVFELSTPADVRKMRGQLNVAVYDDIIATQPEAAVLFDFESTEEQLEAALPMTVQAPAAEMKTDSANRATHKQIIQGVSLVAGDVMDIGGTNLPLFYQIGMLEDQTETAQRLGFGPDQTFPAIVPDLMQNDRQYLFPCNVAVHMFWVNKDTFQRYGQPLPPTRWTIEEFEERGKAFVDAANPDHDHRSVFFIPFLQASELYRSMGTDLFNETLTDTTLDPIKRPHDYENFKRAHELIYEWTHEDFILPTSADIQSFATETGYGGGNLQLFNRGNYAMVRIGRYALIQLRKFGSMNLDVVEPPHGGYPATTTSTRAAAVYKASPNKEIADLFQAYLASEDYNMQIVRDADALPPNPKYTDSEAYRNPPDYPNEHGLHEKFTDAMFDIAVPSSVSPFILPSRVSRYVNATRDDHMNDLADIDTAMDEAAMLIRNEIQRTLEEAPQLQAEYDRRVALQKKIDDLRSRGEKIPLEWISNPFYRKYYVDMGWATPPEAPEASHNSESTDAEEPVSP